MENQEINNSDFKGVSIEEFNNFKKELMEQIAGLKGKRDEKDNNIDINEKIDKKREEENSQKLRDKEIEINVKFEENLKNLVNSSLFGKDIDDINKELENKDYSNLSLIEKNNEKRRAILNRVLKNDFNKNYLTKSRKQKAEEFLKLSTQDQLKKSNEYFDLISDIQEIYEERERAYSLANGGNFLNEKERYVKEYAAKFKGIDINKIRVSK